MSNANTLGFGAKVIPTSHIRVTDADLPNVGRSNVGQPFTDADDAKIREFVAHRYNVKHIAEVLGRTEGAIKARKQRLGLK